MSLYDFANGDPVNYFDADGRIATKFGKEPDRPEKAWYDLSGRENRPARGSLQALEAAEYYASITNDPNASGAAQAAAWVAGTWVSIWLPETAPETFGLIMVRGNVTAPKTASPVLTPGDLAGKSAAQIRALAIERALVPHPTKPGKWMDPVTGKERLRIDPGHIDPKTKLPYNDPKAAAPHHHGYGPDGKTKIVDPSDNNPHFPTTS
jgi:hypothetical protein